MGRQISSEVWYVVLAALVLFATLGAMQDRRECEASGGSMREADHFGVEWECVQD